MICISSQTLLNSRAFYGLLCLQSAELENVAGGWLDGATDIVEYSERVVKTTMTNGLTHTDLHYEEEVTGNTA